MTGISREHDYLLRIAGQDPTTFKNFREAYSGAYADIRSFASNGIIITDNVSFVRTQFLSVFGNSKKNRRAFSLAYTSYVQRNLPDSYDNPFVENRSRGKIQTKKKDKKREQNSRRTK